MQKRFIRICNNAEPDGEGNFLYSDFPMMQEEIIPVDSLLKVYKYCPANSENYVLVYVWLDPVLNTVREFREKFTHKVTLMDRLYELEELLK